MVETLDPLTWNVFCYSNKQPYTSITYVHWIDSSQHHRTWYETIFFFDVHAPACSTNVYIRTSTTLSMQQHHERTTYILHVHATCKQCMINKWLKIIGNNAILIWSLLRDVLTSLLSIHHHTWYNISCTCLRQSCSKHARTPSTIWNYNRRSPCLLMCRQWHRLFNWYTFLISNTFMISNTWYITPTKSIIELPTPTHYVPCSILYSFWRTTFHSSMVYLVTIPFAT